MEDLGRTLLGRQTDSLSKAATRSVPTFTTSTSIASAVGKQFVKRFEAT
jgi:hypothetical protein